MNHKNSKNSYEQHLRGKYNVPDGCELLVKQGYITKESNIPHSEDLTQRGKLLQIQFRIYKLIYDETKNEILKIYSIIDRTKEDIEVLKIQNTSHAMNEDLLKIKIESTAETMIDELSRSIRKLTQKTYEKAYKTLIEEWSGITVKTKELPTDDLIDNELYDTITLWIANFKTWLFENINSAFDDSFSEENSFIQKGLFDNFSMA